MALPESNTSVDGSIHVEYEDDPRPPVHKGHVYFITTPDIGRVPGATGILDGSWPKPALIGAAAKVTLQGVSTMHQGGSTPEAFYYDPDPQEFDDWYALGDALYSRQLRHWQVWKRAADRGTFVHTVNQAWIENGTVPDADEVEDDYRPFIGAFGAWVRAHEPEFTQSEVIVASAVHEYAGRYDAKGVLTRECDLEDCGCHTVIGKVGRWDWKTSSGLYPENMAQLDLYEVAAMEMGEEQADYRAPLRLGKDGSYELSVSRLPVGDSLGLVAGYKARQNVEKLHEHLNPRKGRR